MRVPTLEQRRQLAHYLDLQRQADREAVAKRRAAQFKPRPIRDALLIIDAKMTRELGPFWPLWLLAGAFVGGASLGLLFLGIHDWIAYGVECRP